MTTPASRDWRVILLAVVGGTGALLCLGLGAATTGYALLEPRQWPMGVNQMPSDNVTGVFVLAGGMALIGCVFIATLLAVLQSARGPADPDFTSKPMQWWLVLALTAVWLGTGFLAQSLHDRSAAAWAIPFLHLLAIASPIYVLTRLAIAGIPGGSRLRLWGSMTTGMVLGTGLAAAAEIVLLLAAVAASGLYLLGNPRHVIAVQRLATQLARVARPDALATLGPILTSPLAAVLALAAVAIATPLVEEIAKSVPIWAQYDRLSKGADGFWVGAISGAGFALLEGIMVSADASESLAFILVLRAGSSLMHIVASGLAGWGIGVYRSTGKAARALAGYVAAMGMHSLWNTLVVAIVYGGIRTTYGAEQPDPAGLMLSMGAGMMLVALIGLLPVALFGLNLRFRSRRSTSAAAESPGRA